MQIPITLLFIGLGVLLVLIAAIVFLSRKFVMAAREAERAKARERALIAQNVSHDRLVRIKSEFFQNMSHDFKTPLTVISTSLSNIEDMLNLNKLDPDEMRECLTGAQREIMRMSRMIDSALKLTSMNDSNQEKMPMNIAKVLREGAEVYRALFKRRGNNFSINIPQTLPRVYGNEDLMLHVLSNLFSNSNRHTQNGSVLISGEEKEGKIIITVVDTGAGIAPELLPKIFERGFSQRGTGLGLTICKAVVEEIHKGKISIKSRLGHGTQVTIELPIYKGE